MAVPETAERQAERVLHRATLAACGRAGSTASRQGRRRSGATIATKDLRPRPPRCSRDRPASRPGLSARRVGIPLPRPRQRRVPHARRRRAGPSSGHRASPLAHARVDEVLPQLLEAVGARPRLPPQRALARIRYTPITRGFNSSRSSPGGLLVRRVRRTSESGEAEGLLLDVAELWELFLLHCVRQAVPHLQVDHGLAPRSGLNPLEEPKDERDLGGLKPDIVVWDGTETRSSMPSTSASGIAGLPDRLGSTGRTSTSSRAT